MSVRIELTNLSEVLQELSDEQIKIEDAVGYALRQVGLELEARAKQNASGRPGPNVRTGNLRRSITTSMPRKGFQGNYTVDVSATMVYSRAVELGHPRWKPGVKYPYLGPAARKMQADGSLNRIFTLALTDRLRG